MAPTKFVTNLTTGRQQKLTKPLREKIRNARGEGYRLPADLMFTRLFGIVPNTPHYQRLYADARVDVELIPLHDNSIALLEHMLISFTDLQKETMNPTYRSFEDQLPNVFDLQVSLDDVAAEPRQLDNLDIVNEQIRLAVERNSFIIQTFRPQITMVLVVANTQNNTFYRTASFTNFPADNRGVGSVDFNLADFAIERVDQVVSRLNETSYVYPMWIESVTIRAHAFQPIRGGSYIDLPAKIKNKKCCVNVKNNDQYCILWAYLSSKYPPAKDAQRTSKYEAYMPELLERCAQLSFPLATNDVGKLEEIIEQPINIFGYANGEACPIRFSGQENALNLLLVKDGDNSHYCWIKNFSAFVGDAAATNYHTQYHCLKCLQGFSTPQALANHAKFHSNEEETVRLVMPDKLEMKFKTGSNKQTRHPFVIYADFEALNVKRQDFDTQAQKVYTEHKCISFGSYIVTDAELQIPAFHEYVGEDAAIKFLMYLQDVVRPEYQRLHLLNSELKPNDAQKRQCKQERNCWMCYTQFPLYMEEQQAWKVVMANKANPGSIGEYALTSARETLNMRRVWDHCHITGKPRGPDGRAALCNRCNLASQHQPDIRVYFHNLKGYDANMILNAYGQLRQLDPSWKQAKFDCIAQSSEKFKTFSFGIFKFQDTLAHMPESLSVLMKTLVEKKHLTRHGITETSKGIFPYEWLDSLAKLQEKMPTNLAAYHSCLAGGIKVTQEEVNEAAAMFPTVLQYLLYYQKKDVLGLADVFEELREMAYQENGLDPVWYLSAPQMTMDCALKFCNARIGLMSDIDMYLAEEKSIRGGMSVISTRFAETTDTTKLLGMDANNLYGWSLMQKLPCGNFEWSTDLEADFNKAMALPFDSDKGCRLTVDLIYPAHLHHRDSPYPLAEVHRVPDESKFSKHQQATKPDGYRPTRKLMADFEPRLNYACDYRNLQFYVQQGMVVTKVHSIMWWRQDYIFRDYIAHNTKMRIASTSKFKQDFYKNRNCSLYGKTVENVRDRTRMKISKDAQQQRKFQSDILLKSVNVINQDFIINVFEPKMTVLKMPISIGSSVLDLAKLLMHRAYYNIINHFGRDNVDVLMTDTDSLNVAIKTADLHADLARDDFYIRQLDTSKLSKTHPLFSMQNYMVPGFMKVEYAKVELEGYKRHIGLGPKCYHTTYLKPDDEDGNPHLHVHQDAKAKGVNKAAKNKLTADDFMRVLAPRDEEDDEEYERLLQTRQDHQVELYNIKASHFHLNTIVMKKKALRAFCDKRCVADDGITTYPYGMVH